MKGQHVDPILLPNESVSVLPLALRVRFSAQAFASVEVEGHK